MRHKAEALIETIIAVTIIVIAITASLSILRTSLRGNEVIGEKIVVLNLALEGIEAVKNIRDTNYLRFAANAGGCWMNLSAVTSTDCGYSSSIQPDIDYFFTRNLNEDFFEWGLIQTDATNSGTVELYALDLDSDGVADSELYAESGLSGGAILSTELSPYTRTLNISYTDASNDTLNATVTVTWTGTNGSQSLSLTRTIANVY